MNRRTCVRIYSRHWVLVAVLGCWAALASAADVGAAQTAMPAPLGSHQHGLRTTADGRLILSWVETEEDTSRLRFSIREQGGWSTPRTVVTVHLELAAPPVVLGLSDGALAAAWMVHPAHGYNRYAGEIYLSRSTDGGKHWSEPLKPYSAAVRVYDAQMSLAPLEDGRLALVWTDQRHKHRYQTRATVVDWEGKSRSEILLDSDVCSCCETDTAAQGNALWTAYRDHLEGEVRDISLVRWSSAGPARSALVHNDHWVIEGCPSNGPAVDRRAELTMVSWFTVANSVARAQAGSSDPQSWKDWITATDGVGRVLTAFSQQGVGHFGKPIEVDSNANGYVNALLLGDGSALVAWRDRAGPTEKLQLAQVRQDGTVHGRTTVYHGDFPGWPSRHIGLALVGNSVYVAWTDPEPERVRLARIPLASITGTPGTLTEAE
ncbi:MAG: exo-alpha-sialidase [Nitrococcus sp.]|nr:exo-alpha-sialidase [Nitrococcus sp.]